MPNSAADRSRPPFAGAGYFLPALAVLALAALIDHPLSLVLLLAGDALAMAAICRTIGFDMEASFTRSLARRGLAYFVLLTAYAAFVAALLVGPAWWLTRDGSLPAALALSAALVVALLALWRFWPAFALPFVWDDAYAHDAGGSWLLTALGRSLAFARHLTGEHELFFSHGLAAGLGLLLLTVGALSLAGIDGFLPSEFRIAALGVYALVVVPLTQLVVANRCVRALLTEARAKRDRRQAPADEPAPALPAPSLPPGIGPGELNATLLCAARSGQVDLALAALARGADPDTQAAAQDRDQRSVLILAVTQPDLRLLRALISKRVDVNRTHAGIAPLIAATRDSYQGRPDAVMTLLANGADPRVADADGNTPLHYAALCAEPTVAALLVDAAAQVDALNRGNQTALGIACANANWAVAKFLLDAGARAEVEHAQPALLLAAGVHDDDPAGIKLLLRHKSRPDVRGALERTPLMAAALAGHTRICEALLAAGALANSADRHGTTALMEAARSGAVGAIHALARHKADPDRVDASGRGALSIACASRHASEETVRALLALGADRETVGADGKRALDHAAAAGRWHIVALLDPAYPLPSNLSAGAPPADAASAAHLLDALRFGHWNIADDFLGVVAAWPQADLAGMYLALAAPELAAARAWLGNAGLDPAAQLADGRALAEALLAGLPDTHAALADLVARGAAIGGAGLLARVLAAVPRGAAAQPLRALAQTLLAGGADWCGRLTGELTALHLAVALGDTALTEALLARGADPDARDAQGRTPLHFALKPGIAESVALLRLLVRHGADPEAIAANGETPLGLALARSEREPGYWLNWSRWKLPGRSLQPADLPAAAASGDFDAVERLLALGLAVDAEDAQGATALIRAAGSGYVGLVARLLEAGADPAHAAHSGATCLSAAIAAQREAVVRTLLDRGAQADQRLPGGATPLMLAAGLGLPRLAEPLLERGADVGAADERGTTPLHAAAQFAFASKDTAAARVLLELLLRHGARLDVRNHAGQDVLLLLLGAHADPGAACDAQHLTALATLLLDKGAARDSQDQRGVSPLHACAMHGLLAAARLLKVHGASLDLGDMLGRSPGDVAALLGYVDVAAELGAARTPLPSVRQTLRKPARAPE